MCRSSLFLIGLVGLAFVANAAEPPRATIAVLGGTFINDAIFSRDIIVDEFTVDTKVGTSPTIYLAKAGDVPFYYVHMHGGGDWLETWVALYDLGVRDAIGGATAGGINPSMQPYHFVIPHDFIDFNIDRPLRIPREVYRDPSQLPIPRFVPAQDPDIRGILKEETYRRLGRPDVDKRIAIHDSGVIVQARGGRFESVAEIAMFGKLGADVVTMNVPSEIVYARMLGINYASLIVISNPAEGVAEWAFDEMPPLYRVINPLSFDIVLAAIPRIAALGDKPRAGDALIFHPELTSGE